MATRINPTPTLSGKDAIRFLKKMNTPSTKEEIKALERADIVFKKIRFERHRGGS